MRYAFIHEHRKEYAVNTMCQVLAVGRSGYYDWCRREAFVASSSASSTSSSTSTSALSGRAMRRAELVEQIREVHKSSRELYGSPRVWIELKEQGVKVCENTVARLMRSIGIRSRVHRRFVVHTTDSEHVHPVARNVLNRRFSTQEWTRPNQAWCADITAVRTDRGWLYLAAVIDLCSRRIVGWNMSDSIDATLCVQTLQMAMEQRRQSRRSQHRPRRNSLKDPQPLIHHSDRGVQYACGNYQSLLEQNQMTASMSRTGNCYDNAVMESFFSTLKRECVYQDHYVTREQARASILEYIEVYYNQKRRHSSLDYKSPVEFEATLN